MTNSVAEEIKAKLEVVQFLRQYLTLQPAGKNFKALCPFHKEKTPSFMISPERQSWHCFGCGLSGDLFTFLMRYENLEFGEALRISAERAGVELRRVSPADYEQFGLLYEVNEAAAKFFINELSQSPVAEEYLKARGLARQTIAEFELGFAPSQTEALNLYLLKLGYRPEVIVRAGLALKNVRGLQTDRFRGRIMFPIRTHLGKIAGFTGRILPALETDEGLNAAKYLNTPETPLFNKSRLLYGLHKSKPVIVEAGRVLVVEGQMDFLMSWQAGLKNIIATSGTALTADHLKLLRRFTTELIISFDSDEAGLTAGERAIDLASASDFNVRVAIGAPDRYKDPAEAAQSDPASFRQFVAQAQPAMEFYFDRYLGSGTGPSRLTLSDLKKKLRLVLGKINSIASPVERDHWLRELARRSGVQEIALREELVQLADRAGLQSDERLTDQSFAARRSGQTISRHELLSQHLLGLALVGGRLAEIEKLIPYCFSGYDLAWQLIRAGERRATDPQVDGMLETIYLTANRPFDEEEFKILQTYLKDEFLKTKRQDLLQLIQRAQAEGNEAEVERVLVELQESWLG